MPGYGYVHPRNTAVVGYAFGKIVVDGITIAEADQLTDTLNLVGLNGINITGDPETDTVYISGGGAAVGGTYLISGGGVSWVENYDYSVAAATYAINGVVYASDPAEVTLNAADPDDDRIDLIVVDTDGEVVVLTGSPATNPEPPDVDPDTQLQISFVLVAAGSTEPEDLVVTDVYLNNAEWTYTDNAATLNPDSLTSPYEGTKAIEGTLVTNGNLFNLTNAAPISLAGQDNLTFWIKSKGQWTNKSIRIMFMNNNTVIGGYVVLSGANLGFASSNTDDYQLVVIPISYFNTGLNLVNRLRFRCVGTGDPIGFFIDKVRLEAGLNEDDPGVPTVDGDYGDIAVSSGGSVWTINSNVISSFGRTLTDDANASAARTTLGLGTIATQNANNVSISGGSITDITDLALADGGTGTSLVDPSADRILFWDDSAGNLTWLSLDSSLQIVGTTLSVVSGAAATESFVIAISNQTSPFTSGTNKFKMRFPYAFTLTNVKASLFTAQTSGPIVTVDINKNTTTMLSTKLSIDNGETTSVTAATAVVISVSSIAADDEIEFDIDQIGDGTAVGLVVTLVGHQ